MQLALRTFKPVEGEVLQFRPYELYDATRKRNCEETAKQTGSPLVVAQRNVGIQDKAD